MSNKSVHHEMVPHAEEKTEFCVQETRVASVSCFTFLSFSAGSQTVVVNV